MVTGIFGVELNASFQMIGILFLMSFLFFVLYLVFKLPKKIYNLLEEMDKTEEKE